MGKKISCVGVALALGVASIGQAIAQVPTAPDVPTCKMADGKSDCRFKPEMSGTPTSVVGKKVILFRYSKSGGHGTSRTYLDNAVKRLADRYKFTATITEDPSVFTTANLTDARVVIMSNGDGDVLSTGANRTALEDFQTKNGWGVIWIHAACAFITNGWPYGQQSCVQQYLHHNPSGTKRKFFIDSGTTASPNHGIKNPQSEFLLRNLPGWNGARSFSTGDEYYCFQAPARNTSGVNVLMGYDRSSGLPDPSCPNASDASVTGSQNHNLAWTHMQGKGITIYNSMGHDESIFIDGQNAGDSLLWRMIRYAAKDWEVTPAVNAVVRTTQEILQPTVKSGSVIVTFTNPASNAVTVTDITGKRVFSQTFTNVGTAEIPNLQRGIYFVKIGSNKHNEIKQVRIL